MLDYFIHLDEGLFGFFNSVLVAEWLDPVVILISSRWIWIPLYVYMVYLFFRRFGKKAWLPVLLCIVVFGLSDSISSRIFKPAFKRTRPCNIERLHARVPDKKSSSYGFVSSHAANTAAVFLMFVLLLKIKIRQAWLWFLVPALVSWSRVYLGVHFPADVFFGAVLGMAITMLVYLLFKRLLPDFSK